MWYVVLVVGGQWMLAQELLKKIIEMQIMFESPHTKWNFKFDDRNFMLTQYTLNFLADLEFIMLKNYHRISLNKIFTQLQPKLHI